MRQGLSDTIMSRTSWLLDGLGEGCSTRAALLHAVLSHAPCSRTNTRTAPLGEQKGIASSWWGDRRIFLFITWTETVQIPCKQATQPQLLLVIEHVRCLGTTKTISLRLVLHRAKYCFSAEGDPEGKADHL